MSAGHAEMPQLGAAIVDPFETPPLANLAPPRAGRIVFRPTAPAEALAEAHEVPVLTPEETHVAACAADIHPDQLPASRVALLAHLMESEPTEARRLLDEHTSDEALGAALHERSRQPDTDRAGAGGAGGGGAAPAHALAGERGQPGKSQREVGRGAERPAEIVDGVEVDRSHRIPYLAGMDRARRKVLIDPRVQPLQLSTGQYDPSRALVRHEVAEVYGKDADSGGMAGGKTYQGAHQHDGTAAERELVERDGHDFDEYQRAIKRQARRIHDEPIGAVHPQLDPQPYEDSGEPELLERGAVPHVTDGEPLRLLGAIDVRTVPVAGGARYAVVHPGSGLVIAGGVTAKQAQVEAEAEARRLGRRRLWRMIEAIGQSRASECGTAATNSATVAPHPGPLPTYVGRGN